MVTETSDPRFSAGFRFTLAPSARVSRDQLSWVGGDPQSVVTIESRTLEKLRPLLRGEPLGIEDFSPATGGEAGHSVARAAERLLDLGTLNPLPAGNTFAAKDVTVVVPVHDHAGELRRLLEAPELVREVGAVVVVDDGSADAESLRAICEVERAVPLTLLRNHSPLGPAAARNRGVSAAETEIVLFLDADCLPESGWLAPLLAHFDDGKVAAAAPRLRAMKPDEPRGRTRIGSAGDRRDRSRRRRRRRRSSRSSRRARTLDLLQAYENEHGPLDRGPEGAWVGPGRRISFVPTAALAVRRKAWESAGGLDEELRFGEDIDFTWKLHDAGWLIRYEPLSVVRHEIRSRVLDLLEQRYRYGTPAAQLASRYPGAFRTLDIDPLDAAAWALAGSGLWKLGATAAVTFVLRGAKRLRGQGLGWRAIFESAVRDQLREGAHLAWVLRRDFWPLSVAVAVVSSRARRLVLVSFLVPPLLDWVRRKPKVSPLVWVALTWADGIAHGAGVWSSCIRRCTLRPLVPVWRKAPPAPARSGAMR